MFHVFIFFQLMIDDGQGNSLYANMGGNLLAFLTQLQWTMQQCNEQETTKLQRVFKNVNDFDLVVSCRKDYKTGKMAASVDIRYVKFGDTRLGKTMF
jgi:hypothetical protein